MERIFISILIIIGCINAELDLSRFVNCGSVNAENCLDAIFPFAEHHENIEQICNALNEAHQCLKANVYRCVNEEDIVEIEEGFENLRKAIGVECIAKPTEEGDFEGWPGSGDGFTESSSGFGSGSGSGFYGRDFYFQDDEDLARNIVY